MTTKLEKLTSEQESKFSDYTRMGIEIGLAVGSDMDEKLVRELTDSHRQLCGKEKATNFLVFPSPMSAVKEIKGINSGNALYGQHDIGWLVFYQFFRAECGISGLEKIQFLLELAKRVGWMWMSDDTTIVTRRPDQIHLLEKVSGTGTLKVLHNYEGPAILYRDGHEVLVLNGTRIPKEYRHLVLASAREIDVSKVMAIKNTEIRSEFLKKIGVDRAFSSLNKKLLDEDTLEVGGRYQLYTLDFSGVNRTYLTGCCPSNGEAFYEAVPPECTTVREAISWRCLGKLQLGQMPRALT